MKKLYNDLLSNSDENIELLKNNNIQLENSLKEKNKQLKEATHHLENLKKNHGEVCMEN